jgi:hypothetical protein
MGAMANLHTIRITWTHEPDQERYAAVVLGVQALLSVAGVEHQATIHQDEHLVDDETLGWLADQWATASPWG